MGKGAEIVGVRSYLGALTSRAGKIDLIVIAGRGHGEGRPPTIVASPGVGPAIHAFLAMHA